MTRCTKTRGVWTFDRCISRWALCVADALSSRRRCSSSSALLLQPYDIMTVCVEFWRGGKDRIPHYCDFGEYEYFDGPRSSPVPMGLCARIVLRVLRRHSLA